MSDEGKERDEYTLSIAIEFAQSLLKSLILVNGGAAIAMLAFYGQAAANGVEISGEAMKPLATFGFGVVAALVASFCGYLSLFGIGGKFESKSGVKVGEVLSNVTALIGVIAAVVSIALFCWGIVQASNALSTTREWSVAPTLEQPQRTLVTPEADLGGEGLEKVTR